MKKQKQPVPLPPEPVNPFRELLLSFLSVYKQGLAALFEQFVRFWPRLAPLLRFRGILYSGIFIYYILRIQPPLLARIIRAHESGVADPWLGICILSVNLLELAGFILKSPSFSERIRRWPSKNFWGDLIVSGAAFVHMGMTFFMLILTVPLFGVTLNDLGFCAGMIFFVIFVMLLMKDGVVIVNFIQKWPPGDYLDLDDARAQMSEVLGEILLLIFGMTAFTFTWDQLLVTIPPITAEHYIDGLLGAALMFFLFYPPCRLVFIAEEWLIQQSRFNRVAAVLSFWVTLVVAVMTVPGAR